MHVVLLHGNGACRENKCTKKKNTLQILTMVISCTMTKYSLMTPSNAYLTHKNIVIYCCYMFWCHLHFLWWPSCQNLKVTTTEYKSNSHYITAYVPHTSNYKETCLFTLAAWILWNNANYFCISLSQWLCGLRHRSAAARLLRLWVRIPPGAWISVRCECCVMSGRGLCETSWSLVWRRPTDCDASLCVI